MKNETIGETIGETIDPTWMTRTGGYAKDMTLRDHFAGLAMQYWLSLPINAEQLAKVSTEAYKIADAMLKERK